MPATVAAVPAPCGAPLLETERLRLRAHRAGDFAPLHAIWSAPAVVAHLGGEPCTAQDVWLRMLRYGGLWSLLGYGYWAIEERASGRCIGDIGYADFRRGMVPSLDGMPELGWVLAADVHGRGYASEALAAISAWGRRVLGTHRDVCLIAPANAASIRVAEKAGFERWCEASCMDRPVLLFVRDVMGEVA